MRGRETMSEEYKGGLFDDSRRSFMKKGALATTAVAFGTGATATTGAAQQGDEVLVFGDDYLPGVDFEVVSELEDPTTDDVLETTNLTDELAEPENWNGYIIDYDVGGSASSLTLLFSEQADLSAGDSETMGEDGSFRAPDLNLIEATLGGSMDEEDEEEPPEEDEEEPPEEEENESPGGDSN